MKKTIRLTALILAVAFAAGCVNGPALDADGSGLGVFVAADAGRARAADGG